MIDQLLPILRCELAPRMLVVRNDMNLQSGVLSREDMISAGFDWHKTRASLTLALDRAKRDGGTPVAHTPGVDPATGVPSAVACKRMHNFEPETEHKGR